MAGNRTVRLWYQLYLVQLTLSTPGVVKDVLYPLVRARLRQILQMRLVRGQVRFPHVVGRYKAYLRIFLEVFVLSRIVRGGTFAS